MTQSCSCSETDRVFSSAEAARASESRFREIQKQCEAGQVPELRVGDVIYVDTQLYVWHGIDDFRGGLAEVTEFRMDQTGGKPTPYVRVAQDPDTLHNWNYLAPVQQNLRKEFGKSWSHPDPDFRPEFNDG